MNEKLKLKGRFDVKIFDKHGKLKKKLTAHNGIVNIGKDTILGVMFNAATQITSWFMGLLDNSPAPTLADTDTMASHSGWAENTNYDEATRPAWPEDAPASQQITNSTAAVFTMNATVTIAGFFLTSDNVKGGATGVLWSTALFDGGAQAVIATDVIEVTYTLST